jgi:hypothetical protein
LESFRRESTSLPARRTHTFFFWGGGEGGWIRVRARGWVDRGRRGRRTLLPNTIPKSCCVLIPHPCRFSSIGRKAMQQRKKNSINNNLINRISLSKIPDFMLYLPPLSLWGLQTVQSVQNKIKIVHTFCAGSYS